MKKLTSLLVLFVVATGFCQAPNFDLNQFPLSTYLEAENNFPGGKILNSDYYTVSDDLGLLSYIRKDNDIADIDIVTRYIYYKKDSLILELINEWDVANHNKKINNKKDLEFRKNMLSFYLRGEKAMIASMGKGTVEGNIPLEINDSTAYYKSTVWNLENTLVKLSITMSNNYNKQTEEFPAHKVVVSMRATNITDRPTYAEKELIKRERKEIPHTEYPIIGNKDPIYPGCENSVDKRVCLRNSVRKRILKELEVENVVIENAILKVGFRVEIDGNITPFERDIKSKNKQLQTIALQTIIGLPKMIPSYSKKMDQNVTAGNIFYLIIKDGKIANLE
ncbi:hypothetical protein AX016_3120 [Cellulophaga sp. RHA19]|uniref:hypothetical protein n=1 Tax=Cellulophaga sp. RHA19 TaxID=1798237 RepID=UPI000C2C78F8|nr:hypothetical protein [Cellulophaga sp. RHA19]PKB44888.1 hypothetical protein AX016_3120 [Cellulophaga sp. RHA19]